MATVSALLRSAQSTATAVHNYNDQVAAYEYSNSGYTDDALASYLAYLKTRMDSLGNSTSISDASKLLSLTKAQDSATKQNISATIQRATIQVLSGNATTEDKYNVVASQYARAVNNGDLTLAQSLMSQAYSLSQQVQYERQTAAAAANTLATKTATTAVAAINQRIQDITNSFQDLNSQIKNQGYQALNKTVGDWVKQNTDTLKQLGVVIPDGVQPNYFDLMHGIQGYMYNAYQTAATALQATDPNGAQDYLNKAQNLANGTTKLPGLAGSLTAAQIIEASSNPKEFKFDPSQGQFVKTQVSGVVEGLNPAGQATPQAVYSGSVVKVVDPQLNIQLKQLGVNYNTNSNGSAQAASGTNGVQIEATTKTDPAIAKIIQQGGGVTTAFYNPNLNNPVDGKLPGGAPGGIQFQSSAASGTPTTKGASGQAVYSVVYDKSGHKQVFESSNMGDALIYADPGYNDGFNQTPEQHQSFFGKVKAGLVTGLKQTASGIGGVFGAHASADGLPGSQSPQFTGSLLQSAHLQQLDIQTKQLQQQSLANLPQTLPGLPQLQAPTLPALQAAPVPVQAAPTPIQAPRTTIQGSPVNPTNISSGASISIKPIQNTSTISF